MRTFSPHANTVDTPQRSRQYHQMASSASASNPVRVLTVDDHRVFHDAARALIAATAGFEWIGAASSGEEGIQQAERRRPDLVLMDVHMPGIGGLEAAREIASRGLPTIVVLVTADEPSSAVGYGTTTRIVPKHKLNGALLRQFWESRN